MILSCNLIGNVIVFCLGLLGTLLQHKNCLFFLLYLQLMLLAVASNFVVYANLWQDICGQVFVILILFSMVIQSVLGLAIMLKFDKNGNADE